MKNVVPRLIPYIIASLILIAADLAFFAPQLSGKVLQQSDMISAAGMAHEAQEYFKKTGTATYWTNSMFGGMPTYQIDNSGAKLSLFDYMVWYFNLTFQGPLGYFLMLSLASFLGLCFLGVGPWLALIGGIAISFATNHVGLMSAGHLTKIGALGFVPMIIAGAYVLFNKNWLAGFLIFTFGLAASIRMNHIQMTYYVGLILAFYVIAEIIVKIKEHKIKDLIRPGGALLAGIIISFLVNYSLLVGLNSYAKDTMRGGSILSVTNAQKTDINTASGTNGLGWDYAMQWSNGFHDLLSTIIPGAVGGSSNEEWSKTSKIASTFRKNGITIPQDFKLPLYWGDLPFTSGPDYMGILIIFLFILGLFVIKGPFKWFALFSFVFLMLQSLGKNFSVLNQLLFEYLPYYNKFRTPNSILNVLSSVMPMFAMYGLYQFLQMNWNKDSLKQLFYRTGIPLAGLLIFTILIGPSIFDFKSSSDSGWENNNVMYTALLDTRGEYLRSDAFRSLIILFIGTVLLYFVALKKLKVNYFLIGFTILVLIDLFSIAKRYVDDDDFQTKKNNATNFTPRAVDTEILKDADLSYRVFDLSVNTFNSSITSYFHKTIGGYSPAKLRRYQDMIDYYFSKSNINALSMMNTKYIIDQKGALHTNPNALGNAWFISQVKNVNTPDEEIQGVANINPAEEAVFLQSEFKDIHLPIALQKSGNIKLINYKPDQLSYQSSSTSEQLAVFSEVWYGPNKGWTATIDGKPVEHFRVNYLLRALNIPAGDHKIEFSFKPKDIINNQNISFYAGTLFGLCILISIALGLKKVINQPLENIQVDAVTIKSSASTKPKSKK